MSDRKLLVVATGNPGKLKEMQVYLQDLGWELQLKPEELEIEETGETFIANACLKASEVAKATGQWSIADDSGLMVDALDGQPGIYSARYGKTDADRISRLLTELGSEQNREAQFVCAIAIARPDGTIALQVEGICRGEILQTPRGTGGFGYDPIFYVPAQQQTFAEMTPDIKRSHTLTAAEPSRLLYHNLRKLSTHNQEKSQNRG
ncbi:Nucleoside-triphosphatase rdgB [Microcoleus vaginatus FGP-2]|nr:Nucleoside-triphosphatase rdgB [Microcoleus vaginatus FGP-2]